MNSQNKHAAFRLRNKTHHPQIQKLTSLPPNYLTRAFCNSFWGIPRMVIKLRAEPRRKNQVNRKVPTINLIQQPWEVMTKSSPHLAGARARLVNPHSLWEVHQRTFQWEMVIIRLTSESNSQKKTIIPSRLFCFECLIQPLVFPWVWPGMLSCGKLRAKWILWRIWSTRSSRTLFCGSLLSSSEFWLHFVFFTKSSLVFAWWPWNTRTQLGFIFSMPPI